MKLVLIIAFSFIVHTCKYCLETWLGRETIAVHLTIATTYGLCDYVYKV